MRGKKSRLARRICPRAGMHSATRRPRSFPSARSIPSPARRRAGAVTDGEGNSTVGPQDPFVEGIVPGVQIYPLGETAQEVVLDPAQAYTVTFSSGELPVAVELRLGTGYTTVHAIRYPDLSLPTSRTVSLRFSDTDFETMQYDSDGDGAVDTVITPTVSISGAQAQDAEGPEIAWETTAVGGRRYRSA
ncbi:MAG: hypothetical protein R2856_24145 [Caldilineaceae bacterium]